MKLAFVWSFEKPDGLDGWKLKDDSFQYTIRRLAEDQDKQGNQNKCYILAKNGADIDCEDEKTKNLFYKLRRSELEIIKELTRIDPDVIFAQGFGTGLGNSIPDFFPDTKKVLTYVGGEILGNFNGYNVISVSRDFQKKEVESKMTREDCKVVVVPYGADTTRFKIQEDQKKLVDVLIVASDLPVKRLGLLRQARKELKDLKFSFIGSEARIPYEYMPNVYNSAKISAIVSTREDGGPRVVPESFACGVPVLTCHDSEGVWTATERFEEVGEIVRPRVDNIVEGIKRLIDRCDDDMRLKCREIAEKELSYKQMYKKYVDVLNGLY